MRAVGLIRTDRPSNNGHSGLSESSVDFGAEVQRYCDRDHHQLVHLHVATDSSEVTQAYDSITELFRSGRPALVVLPDATHLADDLETFVGRMIELTELGGEVRCTDVERPDPLQSAEDLLTLKGRSAVRQRRVREAIMAKASRGQVLGRTPYGYQTGTNGQLQEKDEESEVVRQIFEWYAGSGPNGGIGLRLIAQRLNDRGLRTRQGHPWTQVAVAGILRNRVYLGTYSRYGVRIVGSHPAIVERDLFNRAEAVTETRRPVRKRRQAEPFLLSGLLRSQTSGRGLFGLTRRRAWKRQDGTPMEKTYRYYECPHREPSQDGEEEDIKLSWPADKLEAAVREQLAEWPDSYYHGAVLVEDEAAQGPGDQVKLAEREFTRAVRAVASGYGNVRDLQQPLEELSIARRLASETVEATYDDATLRKMVMAEDITTARPALLAVIERIAVGRDSVEVMPKLRASAVS